jgi:hypothetical protein
MCWELVRAFWFRAAHLGAIALVCAESLMGAACPLTTLEGRLRAMSGEASHSRDFVGYWVDRLIYYDFPLRVFMVAYAVLGILVTIVFIMAPRGGPAVAPPHRPCPARSHRTKECCRRSPSSSEDQNLPERRARPLFSFLATSAVCHRFGASMRHPRAFARSPMNVASFRNSSAHFRWTARRE